MAQSYNRVRRPIGVSLVYGETGTDTFEAIALEPNIRGISPCRKRWDSCNVYTDQP